MIAQKTRLFQKFLMARNPCEFAAFKQFRNKVTTELRKAKASFYDSLFSDVSRQRPDQVWKIINEVLNRKDAKNDISEINVRNSRLSGVPLTEYFNEHFVNMVQLLNLPAEYQNTSTIFLEPTDEAEVYHTLMGLKNSKVKDVDDLQIKPVKYVMVVLAPCLAHMSNLVLESGCFPHFMEMAKVSVIFKSGDRHDLIITGRSLYSQFFPKG